jgi:hypothetical protein
MYGFAARDHSAAQSSGSLLASRFNTDSTSSFLALRNTVRFPVRSRIIALISSRVLALPICPSYFITFLPRSGRCDCYYGGVLTEVAQPVDKPVNDDG